MNEDRGKPLRLVVDTNILFAAAVHRGGSRRLVDELLKRGDWQWVATEPILKEYFKVLRNVRFRLSQEELEDFKQCIRGAVVLVEAHSDIQLPADPSDAKFLNCAAAGEADYIISSDSHLLEAIAPEGTRVVNVHDFFREQD